MFKKDKWAILIKKLKHLKNNILHPHTGRIDEETFEKAFETARKRGQKTFIWTADEKFYTTISSKSPQEQLNQYGVTNEQLHNRRWWQERLAQNLSPVGYYNPVERFIEAVIFNIKDKRRQQYPDFWDKIRLDFFNIYNGLPQKNDSLSISDWTPQNTVQTSPYYYRDNRLSQNLKENLSEVLRSYEEESGIQITNLSSQSHPPVLEGLNLYTKYKSKYKLGEYFGSLGAFNLGIGKDAKGYFLYYYDKWDLEVLSGLIDLDSIKPEYTYDKDGNITDKKYKKWHGIKITEQKYKKLEKIKNMLHKIKTDFGKPFEIYDRIYFDKKTFQPLNIKVSRKEAKVAMKLKSQITQRKIKQVENKRSAIQTPLPKKKNTPSTSHSTICINESNEK